MLDELHVSGLGVVADATLELAPGLNVLSGETGAGKTMITVGLALAVGARASPSMVREGSGALSVEARFRLTGPDALRFLGAWVDEEAETGEIVLARTIRGDGRSTARIGGRLAPVSALAALGRALVEIHGQNQVQRLLGPGAQLGFLDRFAGADHLEAVARYRVAFESLRRTRAALAALETAGREQEREKDLLRYQIKEIEAARVSVGEASALEEEQARLAHADRILGMVGTAERDVAGEEGAADRLRRAGAAMQSVAQVDPSGAPLAHRLAGLAAEVEDALADLRAYASSVEMDPDRLEAVTHRLHGLKDLERKYGDGEVGILAYLEEAAARLASLQGRAEEREALTTELNRSTVVVHELAAILSTGRARVARSLAGQLQREVRDMGMPGGRVGVDLVPIEELGPEGAEDAAFSFVGGPGQPSLELGRAASGGELSRVMLACRSVLADLDDVPTLVFDEVDAGIGGRTAGAVARRLARLGARRQVVVVTHLAQIAALADRHFAVTKDGGVASVRALSDDDRVEELARMLSGGTGEVSLAHARELIGAGSEKGA